MFVLYRWPRSASILMVLAVISAAGEPDRQDR
jgi:hypothetical protein